MSHFDNCQHCFTFGKQVLTATFFWRELNEVSIFIKLTYSDVISHGFGLFLIDICLRK